MKKVFCVVVAVVVAFSCLFGCDSKKIDELNSEIARLEALLAQTDSPDVKEMQAKISSLEASVASLGTLLNDAKTDISTLKTQVEALTEAVENINGSTGELASLREAIAELNKNVTALTEKVTALTAQVEESNARIDVLEGIVNNGELPIVDFDTPFVLRNNGIPLFEIRLLDYIDEGSSENRLRCTISNINMPANLYLSRFINAYSCRLDYVNTENGKVEPQYVANSNESNHDVPLGYESKLISLKFAYTSAAADPRKATHFMVGIPNFGLNAKSIIPYVLFRNNPTPSVA